VFEMMQRLTLQTFLGRAKQLGKRFWDEVSACRECGRPGNPLASICRHCGTGNPVKIRVSPQLLFTAAACELVLLFLNLPLD
jgi:ribosomal protein L37E